MFRFSIFSINSSQSELQVKLSCLVIVRENPPVVFFFLKKNDGVFWCVQVPVSFSLMSDAVYVEPTDIIEHSSHVPECHHSFNEFSSN